MPLPKPHIEQDSFFHKTTPSTSSWPTTIYLITGNPGLISYYHTFLSLLGDKLSSTLSSESVHIIGHSLAGFELESASASESGVRSDSTKDENGNGKQEGEHYYDVEEQIRFVQERLEGHMRDLRESATVTTATATATAEGGFAGRPRVILIGHSVGSYIAMEVLRRHRESRAHASGSDQQQANDTITLDDSFDITGSILLFPTVMDIAKSPSGQKLTFLLALIPNLALVISFFAKILTTLLPDSVLRAVIGFVMKSPPADALDATFAFLTSRRGVRQALHMATDEMRIITTDKWSDDIWGVSSESSNSSSDSQNLEGQMSPPPPAQLYFYFGRNDHWVAERTKEEIVAARGGSGKSDVVGRGPRMVVCEESVPHAFCLRHNEVMAGKVAEMVRDILN
ncbi:hypothetical protein BJX70DRAFT_251697 [Aspergillus crustosus]